MPADQTIVRQLEVYADSLHKIATICRDFDDTIPAVEHLELASRSVAHAVNALRESGTSLRLADSVADAKQSIESTRGTC